MNRLKYFKCRPCETQSTLQIYESNLAHSQKHQQVSKGTPVTIHV